MAYAQFAEPFYFLTKSEWIVSASTSAVVVAFGAFLFPSRKEVRIFACGAILVFFSLQNSFGKINGDGSAWMRAGIFMCFLDDAQTLWSKRNFFILRCIQYTLLSIYFVSGLWKLRSATYYQNFLDFFETIWDAFGYVYGQGWRPPGWVLHLIIQNKMVLYLGFAFVLLFQLCAFLPVIKPKLILWFGGLVLAFHLSTALILGTVFIDTMIACLFFLIGVELVLRAKTNEVLN